MKMLRCIPALLALPWRSRPKFQASTRANILRGSIRLDNTRRVNIRRDKGQTRPSLARLAPRFLAPAARAKDKPESRGKRSDSKAQLLTTTAGILRRVAPNQLVIEPDDHRVVWYRLAPQMTVRKDGKDADLKDFALGDYLSVDSNSDDDSIMTAVAVTWKKSGTPDDIAEASKTWDLPRMETVARGTATSSPKSNSNSSASSPPREDGDERPVLRRKDPEPASAPQRSRKPNLFLTSRRKLRQRVLPRPRLLLRKKNLTTVLRRPKCVRPIRSRMRTIPAGRF